VRKSVRKDTETESYEVGYCKPPKSAQFKKGTSGNPSGRSKKALHFGALVMRELKSPVVIDEGGKRKVITKEEAIAKQLVNGAARGNHQARRTVIDLKAQRTGKASGRATA
jgi:Family of unknown function (DUF5681)